MKPFVVMFDENAIYYTGTTKDAPFYAPVSDKYFDTEAEMMEWVRVYQEDYEWFLSYDGKLDGFEEDLAKLILYYLKEDETNCLRRRLEEIWHKNFGKEEKE